MLLCDGRGCSHSVPITFRNRKNMMYHEQDYFSELCNSKCFKATSDLWHVYVHQTSFEALPIAGCAILHPVSHLYVLKVFCSWLPLGSLVWQSPLKLGWRVALSHPHLEGQSQHLALFLELEGWLWSLWKEVGIDRGWLVCQVDWIASDRVSQSLEDGVSIN